jgi:transglutaminase-like putative cysteine protease
MPLNDRPTVIVKISDGAPGTYQTLRIMRELAKAGKQHPNVRALAVALTMDVAPKDWRGEIEACFDFVQNKIRYVKDIRDVETLHTAERILEQGAGDCDDKAVLLCSLLESISHPTRFVAVGFDPRDRKNYSHVFVSTKLGNRWVSLDATMPYPAGWQPPGICCSMTLDN